MSITDFDAEQVIRRKLEPGERILWTGRPGQGLRLRRADRWVIPVSVVWFGVALFVVMTDPGDDLLSWMTGRVFVAAGFFMAVLRIPFDAWVRANTAYGVTDRRALIISGLLYRTTRSCPYDSTETITLAERRDGEGDVVLDARDISHVAVGGTTVGRRQTIPDAFEFLPDARHVYEIVRTAHHGGSC